MIKNPKAFYFLFMKRNIYLFFAICFVFSVSVHAQKPESLEIQSIENLLMRIMPKHADQFKLKLNALAKHNYYKISTSDKKIVIEGNSPTSIASGINYYLKNELETSYSWTNFQLQLPEKLPLPKKTIQKESPYEISTYFNYCTFGYTTVYWDWNRWEKEIDWMALNGITHPLAMVGVEKVWYNFLQKVGYSSEDAKRFLTGPVYMPWLLMGNIENIGGPMPDEWFDRQVVLQNKILERMRSYGMKPIFQAFYGMVPTDFKNHFPNAQIIDQGKWFSFNRPSILSPLDNDFKRFAGIWYDEYTALFGKADFYAGDLFHEGGQAGTLDVTAGAKALQTAMLQHNPDAVWVVQGWGHNPTPKLLKGLDPQHSVIIELCAEYWNRWKEKDAYAYIPWVWSNISNWGGNIGSHGRLDAIATRPIEAQQDTKASKTLKGIGYTPEGIGINPVIADLWSDMIWTKQPFDMEKWIANYVQYRYGNANPPQSLQDAWKGFYHTIYGTYEGSRQPSEPVFCAEPSLAVDRVSTWSQCKIYYNPDSFAVACSLFLQSAEDFKNNANYSYDAVDMVRQYISNLGRITYADIQAAWKNKDKTAFDKAVSGFLQLIKDQNELLLTHRNFCLQPWLQSARDAGSTQGIKDQYEYYNRLILTSWEKVDGALNDYAHRELGGFLGTYYYKRWDIYFNYLNKAWNNPDIPNPNLFAVTQTWLYEDIDKEIQPSGKNPVETAVKMFEKYYRK